MTPDLSRASAYDYPLPEGRIAQEPVEPRDASKLMVVRRDAPVSGSAANGPFEHRTFRDIVDLIPAGDALVLNETRVFPARLRGSKPTGAPAEILLLRPASNDEREWDALVRPGGKLKPGRVVDIGEGDPGDDGGLRVHIIDSIPGGGRRVRMESGLSPRQAIERWGEMPLPPYIDRPAHAADREHYQTVYARTNGSVAAPTAGLHFTPAVLEGLEARGVGIERVTLHVGLGTFRPVDADALDEHEMHAEWYDVPADVAGRLNAVRGRGGSLWAVGTTVTRTLESVTGDDGVIRAGAGWTDLFIRPPYTFRAVDRLLTNFHLPKSTLLMLVSAFAGYELTMRVYRAAIEEGYRFYSYGDAMVVV